LKKIVLLCVCVCTKSRSPQPPPPTRPLARSSNHRRWRTSDGRAVVSIVGDDGDGRGVPLRPALPVRHDRAARAPARAADPRAHALALFLRLDEPLPLLLGGGLDRGPDLTLADDLVHGELEAGLERRELGEETEMTLEVVEGRREGWGSWGWGGDGGVFVIE
jgi:hypothetical protein